MPECALAVTFPRIERFPEIVWLAPGPAEPFVAMTEAMVGWFPDRLLPLHSRVESVVLYEHAEADRWLEVQAVDLSG